MPASLGAAEPEWEEVAPGISCKLLATDAATDRVSMLVRLAPGADYPPHRHAGLEELYLLRRIGKHLRTDNVDHRLRRRDFRDEAADPVWPWLGCSIAELEERGVLGDFRPGAGIRFGPHFFTTDDEIHFAVDQIVDILETGAYVRHVGATALH